MREASDFSVVHSDRTVPDRLARGVAGWLIAASILYAAAAPALLPHKRLAIEIVDVFVAGALPGLLMTLVLWVARPGLFDRRLRRRLIGISLVGSAVVATIPLMTGGF
jgi:hypothetical protein